MEYTIIPGILRRADSDFNRDLQAALKFASTIQIDIIDGKFAPHATIDIRSFEDLQTNAKIELDLMVDKPEETIEQYLHLPFVDNIIIHVESTNSTESLIEAVHKAGKKIGMAINPDSPLEFLEAINGYDSATFMTVTPGEQGQPFIESVLDNVIRFRALHPNMAIEVDGGMNEETLPKALAAGANRFVAGSFIFGHFNPAVQYDTLHNILQKERQTLL